MDTLPLELNSLLSDITTEEIKDKSGQSISRWRKDSTYIDLRVTNPGAMYKVLSSKDWAASDSGLEICWKNIPFCRRIPSP